MEKRIASAKNRPATIKTLQSSISAHFHKVLSPEEVSDVIEAMKVAGYITTNGQKVVYAERG